MGYSKEKKLEVIEYWVNHPNEALTDICKACKIGHQTFWRWRNEEEFMQVYHQKCKKRFQSLQAIAVQKLGEQVVDGNFSAVKYVLDSQGYNATQKIETNSPTVIKVTIEGEEE